MNFLIPLLSTIYNLQILFTYFTNHLLYFRRFLVPVIAISFLFTQMAQLIEEKSDETIIVHGFQIHLKGTLRRYYSRRFSG